MWLRKCTILALPPQVLGPVELSSLNSVLLLLLLCTVVHLWLLNCARINRSLDINLISTIILSCSTLCLDIFTNHAKHMLLRWSVYLAEILHRMHWKFVRDTAHMVTVFCMGIDLLGLVFLNLLR